MLLLLAGQNTERRDNTLRLSILALGHGLADKVSEIPDLIIFFDWKKSHEPILRKAKALKIPAILLKFEPHVVIKDHLNPKIDSKFARVIEVGRANSATPVFWPQNWNLKYFDNNERFDRAVAVSGNKFSFMRGELYSLRASVYGVVDSLDVFGTGWGNSRINNLLKLLKEFQLALTSSSLSMSFACINSSRIRPLNLMGPVHNKLEAISRYKVSLVIENTLGYMTEKLLDSIFAGTIPVYVGPQVEIFGIPKNLVVTAEPSVGAISRALIQAGEIDHEDWKEQAREWMNRPGVKESWNLQGAVESLLKLAEGEIESQ